MALSLLGHRLSFQRDFLLILFELELVPYCKLPDLRYVLILTSESYILFRKRLQSSLTLKLAESGSEIRTQPRTGQSKWQVDIREHVSKYCYISSPLHPRTTALCMCAHGPRAPVF